MILLFFQHLLLFLCLAHSAHDRSIVH